MNSSERPGIRMGPPTKLAPGTTVKKLPWLDGRSSSAKPHENSLSPTTRRKPSILAVPKRVATAYTRAHPSPVVRKKLVSTPTEHRILAIESPLESSPSPITRHRMAQSKRNSTTQHVAFHPSSVAHEPRKRLLIVDPFEPSVNEESIYEHRLRADSLAPVPDHLQRSSTSESTETPIQCDVVPPTAKPVVVSRVQTSPSRPRPGRNPFERVGNRRISNAIENLEDMVQEAVDIADDTADCCQVEEIYGIIEDARQAIQETSGDQPRHFIAASSPLPASSSPRSVSDWDDFGGYPKSIEGARPPPPLTFDLESGPKFVDWAYQPQGSSVRLTSSSSSSSGDERGRSRHSTRSDLLLPPNPTQNAPREHVDFVLRPVARDRSRGRPYGRDTGDPAVRSRKHRRHRHVRGRSSSDGKTKSKSLSRHERQGSSESILADESFDEESLPPRQYGQDLRVREQIYPNTFNLRRHHHRQPIARNWGTGKKRLTAIIACINTALLGIIIGVYAGEVPRIQYYLADESHISILGNVVLYVGLAISTCIAWPLPLLHGRKPYILAALALAMPLQFPQAMVISAKRSPTRQSFRAGLLCARAATGLVLGFANVNYITVLLDLFGASLQSKNPHQEYVVPNDVRRHGGGMGLWLGIWSWCWIASLAVGFMVGAVIIESLSPDWGFYVVIIMLAAALLLNIVAPETRRAAYRKSVTEVYDRDENYITRRVSRGECKLHISTEGPLYWFEEVWAGLKLMTMMMCQPGFFVLALYLAWIYAQVVLVIVLLGSLLSRNYKWQPRFVGAGVTSIAIGAFLALPLTKARIFSRERKKSFRTDSMTFQKQVTWSSHLVRRAVFTITLPLMGLAYTISSAGRPRPFMVPIAFSGALGFFSILAIAECHGLMMETFDTCDLQPGVNTKHRLESMAVQDRRRRTNYTSFPRVTAGIFASQTMAFIGGAVATEVGGIMTRRLGAQTSTGVTAGILLCLTVLLTMVLVRFREVQVIPNHTFGTRRDTAAWEAFGQLEKMGRGSDWKAVVIGHPSGKMRRMSVLELGSLSRWTEIRKLNFLLKGPRLGEKTSGPRPRTWRDGW
ncbi:Omega-amidase [Ascochyta lentis]